MLYELRDMFTAALPYTYGAGAGALTAVALHSMISVGRGLRAGTTFREQLARPQNIAASAAIGIVAGTAAGTSDLVYDPTAFRSVVEYAGVAAAGAITGSVIRPIAVALRTPAGPTTNLADRVREGAVRGAIAFPLGYAALDVASRLF